jgi:hypothetical protein
MMYIWRISWYSSKDPVVCNFHFNLYPSSSQTVQDLMIMFWIHCGIKWWKLFMNYPMRKKSWQSPEFWVAHASFLLSWRFWHISFLTLPLGFRVKMGRPTFFTCYDPIKKIWISLGLSSISADTVIQHALWSRLKFFGIIIAHTFLVLRYCVTIW